MGYNLTIDQGNSAAKIVVWHNDEFVAESFYKHLTEQQAIILVQKYNICSAIYCSVAQSGNDIIKALRQTINGNVIELTCKTPMPIGIDYATPATLGKDRIAAAVGAYMTHRGRTVLVIDLGTAITYDVVSANGSFIGGNIAPGMKMRLDALHHFTARLPQIDITGEMPLWGIDTETALRSGAMHGIIGEINYYRSKLPNDTSVVLTGGSATAIQHLLNFDTEIDPHLVNKGLNCILNYNENK